jgi:hypothetical protein
MNKLSPLAKELVQAGRNAPGPTSTDKLRVKQRLEERLASSSLAASDATAKQLPNAQIAPNALLQPTVSWTLAASLAVGAAVVAGGLAWYAGDDAQSSEPSSHVSPPLATTASPERLPSPEASTSRRVPRTEAAPTATETALRPPTSSATDTRRSTRLGEEVALLARATSQLRDGRAEEALRTLSQHQRDFPNGSLTPERRAARAQALCALGRHEEARRELDRLSPSSPQAVRARQLCERK